MKISAVIVVKCVAAATVVGVVVGGPQTAKYDLHL